MRYLTYLPLACIAIVLWVLMAFLISVVPSIVFPTMGVMSLTLLTWYSVFLIIPKVDTEVPKAALMIFMSIVVPSCLVYNVFF